jgi:DNA polymerase III subunit epsilon
MNPHRISLEHLAETLRLSGQYRVYQKFAPRSDWPLDAAVETRRAVLVDVETTGLNHDRDAIIQLAVCPIDYTLDGTIVRADPCQTWLEDPGRPLDAAISKLTGLTDDDLRGQRIDDEAVTALLQPARLVIAHNAAFDRPFLDRRLPVFAEKPWACTWRDVPWMHEGFANQKLEWLVQELCGKFFQSHCATADTEVLVELLAARLPVSDRTVLAALLESARTPRVRVWAERTRYEDRTLLKDAGYQWSAPFHCWYRDIPTGDIRREREWLGSTLRMVPRVDGLSLLRRFSASVEAD